MFLSFDLMCMALNYAQKNTLSANTKTNDQCMYKYVGITLQTYVTIQYL